jgi:hypothetical protein
MNIKRKYAQIPTINICASIIGLRDRDYFIINYTKIEYIHERISGKRCSPADNALTRTANRNKRTEQKTIGFCIITLFENE